MTVSRYQKMDDPKLVSLCLKGDSEAWETLIMRYRRLIFSIPVKFGFSPADCSDVFQTVCVKLIEHLASLKDESKVSAWLITTTTRHCIQVKSLKYRMSRMTKESKRPRTLARPLRRSESSRTSNRKFGKPSRAWLSVVADCCIFFILNDPARATKRLGSRWICR